MFLVIAGVNANELALYIQQVSQSLKKYAEISKKEQDDKEAQYKALVEARKEQQNSQALVPYTATAKRTQDLPPVEKPLPNNKIEVYDPDVFGLEVAARDCRFEMIKIVREVC